MNTEFENNNGSERENDERIDEIENGGGVSEFYHEDSAAEAERTVGAGERQSEESVPHSANPTAEDLRERMNAGFAAEHEQEKEEVHKNPGFTVTQRVSAKSKRRFPRIIALALVGGIVAGSAFGFANSLSTKLVLSKVSIGTTDVALKKGSGKTNTEGSVSEIVSACMPSIVAITNRSVSDVMTFFGTYSQESTSTGSGIVIGKNDSELLIVTNYHVVANSKALSVIFSSVESKLESQNAQSDLRGELAGGSSELDANASIPSATVKGYNSDKDLAVIAVALKDIPEDVLSEVRVATIGDSSKLKAGDQVIAIGNALGYGQSTTVGYISATNRKISMESTDASKSGNVTNSFIQTDAAINPGNSGGALLNMSGEVIGINSVKIAANGVEGMGYAIPISDVGNIIDELMVKKTRSVVDEKKQGFLGITGATVSSSASQAYGIPTGVFVNSVTKGLAAEKAGIQKGYVITAFDGYSMSSIEQLQDRLTYYKSGEKVKVTVQIPSGSEYKEKKIEVTLSNRSKSIDKVGQDENTQEGN